MPWYCGPTLIEVAAGMAAGHVSCIDNVLLSLQPSLSILSGSLLLSSLLLLHYDYECIAISTLVNYFLHFCSIAIT